MLWCSRAHLNSTVLWCSPDRQTALCSRAHAVLSYSPGYVQEEDGVHLVLPQLVGDVDVVTHDGHVLREVLPPPLQQVLPARLAVEHLVPESRAELVRPRL